MKFDSRYSAPIRPIFRVLAVAIGIPMLLVGAALLIEGVRSQPFEFDGDLKAGISGTVCGLVMVIAGIKGHLPKWLDSEEREKAFDKKMQAGKVTTKNICLRSIGGFILSASIITLMFASTEVYSILWWLTLVMTLFIAYLYYLSFATILGSKGFNPYWALTFIFPLTLLIIGVFNPKKFEKMTLP
jgi:hypothetical protein